MKPTLKQKQALKLLFDFTTEFVGYGGSAGGGKTYIGCLWLMMSGQYAPNTRYFIGRDNIKQTRNSVMNTWRKLANDIGFTEWKDTGDKIIFDNGSEIELLDLTYYPYKDPMYERFGSKEFTSGWIEEAGGVHYMAFEILKTRIGRWMNKELNIKKKILNTFNPKKNWVDTTFYRPFINNKESIDTKFVYALPTDNPHLPPDYIETLNNLKDEATKQRLLFGNFDYDDDPTALIDFKTISDMFTNTHIEKGNDRYIIGDVARFGSDKAVIMVWYGLVIVEVVTLDKSTIPDQTNIINAMRSKHQIGASNVLIDSDGVGGGLVDAIAGSIGFINGGKPIDKGYFNIKCECGYKLSELASQIYIEADLSDVDIDTIKQELGQLKTFDADKDRKIRILPKEKIKQNIGHSPDFLDVFIMRMWFELDTSFGFVGVA